LFDDVVDPFYSRGEEGFLEFWMLKLQDAIHCCGILWPETGAERPRNATENWTREQRIALAFITETQDQLSRIRLLRSGSGQKLRNKRGYAMFGMESGKKDLSRACLYAFAGFYQWATAPDVVASVDPASSFGAFTV
jgi:hypothetical protein